MAWSLGDYHSEVAALCVTYDYARIFMHAGHCLYTSMMVEIIISNADRNFALPY